MRSPKTCREKLDLETFHEEADVITVQQMARLAQSGVRSISVVSDDTDVFVPLMHCYADLHLTCNLTMKATGNDRTVIDIAETAKEHSGMIVANLLAMHCLSGCDTVAVVQLFEIGKGSGLKTLKAGDSLNKLGYLHIRLAEVISEATLFMAQCYGSKKEVMSDVRVELWAKKMSKNV